MPVQLSAAVGQVFCDTCKYCMLKINE